MLGRFSNGVVIKKSTKCRSWPFFPPICRIRCTVVFDERVFDENSCVTFASSLDLEQARHSVGPDLEPNCLIL